MDDGIEEIEVFRKNGLYPVRIVPDQICPDCGRQYKIFEQASVRVEGRDLPVWQGCIDCWVKRTSPEMCASFENVSKPGEDKQPTDFVDIGPEAFAMRDLSVIGYKGENYYRSCGVVVKTLDGGEITHCVRRSGHPDPRLHEDYFGNEVLI